MEENISIHKILISYVFILISMSHAVSAMENKYSLFSNYQQLPRTTVKLTEKIRDKVDRILVNFKRNMDEYYKRTRAKRATATPGTGKISFTSSQNYRPIPITTLEVDARGVYDLQNLQKKVAQAGANFYSDRGKKYTITHTPVKGSFGVVYLEDTPYALKVSNGQALKGDTAKQLKLCPDELDQFAAINKILTPKKHQFNLNICLPHTGMRVKFKNTSVRYQNDPNYPYWNANDSWNVQIMPKIASTKKMEDIIKSAVNRNQGGLELIYNLGKDLGTFQSCFLEKNYSDGTYNTLIHGDLSFNNIIYDGCFNVIDNSSMGKGRPILTDPLCFLYSSSLLFQQLDESNKINIKYLLQKFYGGYMSPFVGSVRTEIKRYFNENVAHRLALQGTHFANLQRNIQLNIPQYVTFSNEIISENMIIFKSLYNGYYQGYYQNNLLGLYPIYGHSINSELDLYKLDSFANIQKEVIKAI